MDHTQAIQLGAVEKYLLKELPPGLRDEFEEHYFDCSECTTDLKATAAFMEAAKKELGVQSAAKLAAARNSASPARPKWRPLLVGGALAASLLVLLYQNVFVYPHYQSEVAQLQAPELPASVSLVGGNSRGDAPMAAATVHSGRPFLMLLDVPTQGRFASYTCKLYSPAGAVIWKLLISSERAKDTVTISAPMRSVSTGNYSLAVEGNAAGATEGPVLARYGFHLDVQP